jgi:hypothetical protein
MSRDRVRKREDPLSPLIETAVTWAEKERGRRKRRESPMYERKDGGIGG